MNSFGNTDVKTIENKAYTTIETEKANELIERLNKENILFYARYDEKKISLQFNRNDLDKINSIAAELTPPKSVDTPKQPDEIPKEVKAESAPVTEPIKDIPAEREKLIPLMETLTAHQESKINNAQEKVQSHSLKIGKNENKIARLKDRSQRLRNVTDFLKALSKNSSIPGIKRLVEAKIEKNEQRISYINENKIPMREEKIAKHKAAIDVQTRKIEKSQDKIDRYTHLSNFVKSFGFSDRAERHEHFMSSLINLNGDSQKRTAGKLERCVDKLQTLNNEYSLTDSAVKKTEINAKIVKLNGRRTSLSGKLDKLQNAQLDYISIKNNEFGKQTTDLVNGLIENSGKALDNALTAKTGSISSVIDAVALDNAGYIADKVEMITFESSLKNAEMSVEQNANMIDGVINNLPTEEVQEIKAEAPPEHSQEQSEYENILPKVAETLDISVAQVMALPEELKEIAAALYINNSDMPKNELKEILSDTLELTPQSADIPRSEQNVHETAEIKDVSERKKPESRAMPVAFSRAAQKEFTEIAEKNNIQLDRNEPKKSQETSL